MLAECPAADPTAAAAAPSGLYYDCVQLGAPARRPEPDGDAVGEEVIISFPAMCSREGVRSARPPPKPAPAPSGPPRFSGFDTAPGTAAGRPGRTPARRRARGAHLGLIVICN